MRNWMSRSYCVAGLLTCFAAGAFATPSLTLVDANANYAMGGVYTSPYNISVNGGTPTLMICDDFLTDIGLGYTWSATISSLTALQGEFSPSNQVKFDHTGSPSPVANDTATQQIWDYATAAYLANELILLQSYGNETAGEISYAIWGIFDTPLLMNSYQAGLSAGAEGKLTSTELMAAQTYLNVARAATSGVTDLSTLPHLTIYTSNPQTGSGSSQEFLMVSMAEPSYPTVLAVDLLAIVSLVVVFRRRLTNIIKLAEIQRLN